jgi:replicative DNA helicase
MRVQDEIDTEVLLLPNGAPIIEGGEFPENSFPPVMLDYALSLSTTYAVPVPLFLGMMLGAISGAAGKGWKLTGGAGGFGNYANLFLLFALETGSHKSIVSEIIKPITEAQQKRMDHWKLDELPVIKAHLERYKREQSRLGKDVSQSERNDLAKQIALYEEKLKKSPAIMLGSATTSALAQNLEHMDLETAFLFSPEAGDMVRVALGLYRDNGIDADLLLSGFTGEPFAQNRVGSGNVDIRKPCVSLLGMVQPCVLREVLAHKEAKERGLVGRFLFIPLGHSVFFWKTYLASGLRVAKTLNPLSAVRRRLKCSVRLIMIPCSG